MDIDFLLPWSAPLESGRLVRRYHRFLADIVLDDGRAITAHCVNSGMMEGLVRPGARVWVCAAANPSRKLAFTWCAMEIDGVRIGTDIQRGDWGNAALAPGDHVLKAVFTLKKSGDTLFKVACDTADTCLPGDLVVLPAEAVMSLQPDK